MSKTINPADEEATKAATSQPHSFVYVDKILNAKTDGYLLQLTLGWKTPQESYAPVATVAIPVPFARQLIEQLRALEAEAAQQRARPTG